MGTESSTEFPRVAIVRVAQVATSLGVKYQKPQWGLLGGMLMQVEGQLYEDDPETQRRVHKLLRDVESMCSLSTGTSRNEFPLLRAIAYARLGSSEYREAEDDISRGLYRKTLIHQQSVERAIRHLDRFKKGRGARQQDHDDDEDSAIKTDASAGYPNEVDSLVSTILRDRMACTCGNETMQLIRGQHLAQLMLWPPLTNTPENGQVRLDMLFSSVPVCGESQFCRWQNVELQICWSKKQSRKRARFSGDNFTVPTLQISEQLMYDEQKKFCTLLGLYPDSRVRLVIQDGEFQGSQAVKPIEQIIEHEPGISLARILSLYSLTSRMRAALAYIIAYSVWQYYDSDWVKARWTSESIQFLKEYQNDNIRTEGKLFAWKPHLSMRIGEDGPKLLEYSTARDEMHRYPRIRALGVLLVEIGTGLPLNGTAQNSPADDPDGDWWWAMKLSRDKKRWKGFDFPAYLSAVKSCLNSENFFSLSHRDGNDSNKNDISHRRSVLYQKVVTPLERLLRGTGWMEDLTQIGPLDTIFERNNEQADSRQTLIFKPEETSPSQPTATKTLTKSQKDAKKWFSRMNALNESLTTLRVSYTPIRIAILDTGCNKNSSFFFHPRISYRLKGWKDLVSNSNEWQDHDGHGTYLTSIIMKIAPEAEVYVARIAESPKHLLLASENVAKAIFWASNECNVDIISMSFGFSEEQPSISKAIHEALFHRNGSILFFAAASNYGANEKEMFPARHESVISIRATNFNGDFLDLNPPRNQSDGVVFGTLGFDVPSEPGDDGEKAYRSGTSVATAISASIAGALLGYVSRASNQESSELVKNKLRTRLGMQSLFRALARPSKNEQYLYLAPWVLEGKSDKIRWSIIESAIFNC